MIHWLVIFTLLSFPLFSQDAFSQDADCEQEVLLYIAKDAGNFDIYLNDLKGNETRLTENEDMDWSPRYNPAQNRLFYNSMEAGSFIIRAMDLSGNMLDFDAGMLEEYNLSPDGALLAVQEKRDGGTYLMILDPERDTLDIIGEPETYSGRAVWSPGSDQLAFITDRDGSNELYVYRVVDQEILRITKNDLAEKYVSWSPDGKQLAFTVQFYEEGKPDTNEIYIYDLVTGESNRITDGKFNDAEIAWSPYSGLIAFHSTRENGDQIYLMEPDGTGIRQLTTSETYHGEPHWAIDTSGCR